MVSRKLMIFSCLLLLSWGAFSQEKGMAGYYADEFQGRKTASGEPYDLNQLTGAHRTAEFGSYLKVTRTDNKKSVIIKVNDRGPYLKTRVVDLSKKAAEAIGLIRDGIAEVIIEPVSTPDELAGKIGTEVTMTEPVATVTKETTKKVTPVDTSQAKVSTRIAEPVKVKAAEPVAKSTPSTEKPAVIKKPAPEPAEFKTVTAQDYKDFDLYKIQLMRPKKEGFGVQVGLFKDYENVLKRVAELQEDHFKNILISIEKGDDGHPAYKIILGPFPEQSLASSYKASMKKKFKVDGFIVNLSELKHN